jgi:4-amino-4-deoxychorismate lyase
LILINGETNENIAINDRGLLYGDGIFTTMAVKNGQVLCWQQHWQRLVTSCKRLSIPLYKQYIFEQEIKQLIQAQDIKENHIIKCIITRGIGGRGYTPPIQVKSTRILMSLPFPNYHNKNITLQICKTRLSKNPLLAGIKSLNCLPYILARAELIENEGLLLDTENNIIEGTISNIFFVDNGILKTPSLQQSGVDGIIRQLIIKNLNNLNITIKIGNYNLADLYAAQEIFLTNSIIGLWSVNKFDSKVFQFGKFTKKIQNYLQINKLIT